MWFLSKHDASRTPPVGPKRRAFCPRLEALEDRCLLSAGALDTTFGSGGLVTGPVAEANAVVVYPNTGSHPATDGKIVAGGYVGGPYGYEDFALVRYKADGSLDTSFGTSGVVRTQVGVGDCYINGLAIDSQGNVVAVGQAVTKLKGNKYALAFAVARYLPTGALDNAFGSGGIVLTNVESDQNYNNGVGAFAVAIDGSGNIDVAGTASSNSSSAGTGNEFALARYKANGTLDTAFGPSHNGLVITPQFVANQPATAFALTIQADGKIILAGTTGDPVGANTSPWSMAVARYTTGGLLDSTANDAVSPFGTGGSGIVTGLAPAGYHSRAHGVLVQSTGAIVIAANSYALDIASNPSHEYQTLTRLTSSGQLDLAFGGANTGYAINTNLYGALALAQSANGDLLAASATLLNVSGSPNEFGVAAFLPDGTPDSSFGTSGTATATAAFSSSVKSYGAAMAGQPDGKVVVAGLYEPVNGGGPTSALARFLPPNTKIGSFSGSSSAGSVTLSASNIMNSNPTSPISHVYFYLQNPDTSLTLVGTGANNSGTWALTFSESTYALISGNSYTFVAQAVDSSVPGVLSDPVTVSFTVM
jgi:uncharacterized delta-60 repeat protein